MKLNLKKLVALLLAAMLMLSMYGLNEESIVVGDNIAVEEASGDGIPAVGDLDLDGQLDILDSMILYSDLQTPVQDQATAPEEINDDEAASNALVKKVRLGVNEKYIIDTRSLSGKLTFKSSKPDVANVSKKGIIKGKKVGTAKISVTTAAGKKYKITVTVAKAPTKVTLNKKSLLLKVGETFKLKAKLPSKTASNKITWTSSNKNVATVSNSGKVKAKAAGSATITVKTFNGKKMTCKVTVKNPEPKVTPTPEPTAEPTGEPTVEPTTEPTVEPTIQPTAEPTIQPTAEPTIQPTAEPTAEPTPVPTTQPPVLSADQTNMNIQAGKSQNVRITYLNDNTIVWKVSDSNIVTCQWVGGWDGNTCQIAIIGLRAGSATVTVYDKVTQDYVDIYVTVYGQIETISELSKLLFKTIPEANAMLDLQLTHYQDNMYTCTYFSVLVDSSGAINTIGFFNNYGSYTLMGQWPGRSLTNAANSLFKMGFVLKSDIDQLGTFTHPDLPGCRLLLKYANSKVDYIIFTTNTSNVSNSFVQRNT